MASNATYEITNIYWQMSLAYTPSKRKLKPVGKGVHQLIDRDDGVVFVLSGKRRIEGQ